MHKLILFFLLLIPVSVWSADLSSVDMSTVHKSSCRVRCFKKGSTTGSIGSGVVCGRTDTHYLILTNNHVVEGCNIFQCDWFNSGEKITAPAELLKTYYYKDGSADFAFLSVRAADLKGYDPPVIPLADEGTKPAEGSRIVFSGCSEGRWASCWVGTIKDYFGTTAQFTPAPKPGQSGSSIVQNIGGELVVTAVLTWRIGDEKNTSEEKMLGGAIPVKNLWAVLDGKKPAGSGQNIPDHSLEVDYQYKNIPAAAAEHAILTVEKEDREYIAPDRQQRKEVFMFSGKNCPPCQQAEKDLPAIIRRHPGWIIRVLHEENKADREFFAVYRIEKTPAFIVAETDGSKVTRIIARWIGAANLEAKLEKLLDDSGNETVKQDTAKQDTAKQTDDGLEKQRNAELIRKRREEEKIAEKKEQQKPAGVIEHKIELPIIPGHHPKDYSIENGKVQWDMTRFQSSEVIREPAGSMDPEVNGLADFFRRKKDEPKADPEPETTDPETKRNGPLGGVIDRGLDKISGSADKVIAEKIEIFKADFFKYFDQILNKIIIYGSLIFAGIMLAGHLFGGLILKIVSAIIAKLPKIQFITNTKGDQQ